MRKLASVQTILSVDPIDGADSIEVATVGGWKVVVLKGEYQAGDLAVFCEIDSWVPHDLAPFLSKGAEPKTFNDVKGARLRTIKLRKQLSQGLLLPLSVLPQAAYSVGDDATEILGIQKWEATLPAQLRGGALGLFPSLVPKTDQERVQNLSEVLPNLEGLEFEITEKLDGSSCTFFLDSDGEFHVCSRNLDLRESDTNAYWQAARKYGVEQNMRDAKLPGFAIQGELIGPGIQGNPYKRSGVEFYTYDAFDSLLGAYLPSFARRRLCEQLKLPHVPLLDLRFEPGMEHLLHIAEGKSVFNPGVEREGIVLKCLTEPDIHFKSISNRFLLGEK